MITYFGYAGLFFGSDDDEGPGFFGTILVMILGPVAATMIQLTIARSREFAADDAAVRLTGDPLALASALRKIEMEVRRLPLPENGRLASAGHMMIVNPFRGARIGRLFATHPPVAARIARLERMAGYRR